MEKTKFHTAEGYVEYAQTFEANRDMGTNGSNPQVDKARKKTDGLYKIHFYPKDEETYNKMLENLSDPMFQGHPRFRHGNDLGVGMFTSLQRKHKDPSGIEDFGGAPEVVYWQEDNKNTKWTLEDDGPIWNGAYVIVKYSTYGEGESQTVRLVKVGVIENGEMPEGYDPEAKGGF